MSDWMDVPPGVISKKRYRLREWICRRCGYRTIAEIAPECHGRMTEDR